MIFYDCQGSQFITALSQANIIIHCFSGKMIDAVKYDRICDGFGFFTFIIIPMSAVPHAEGSASQGAVICAPDSAKAPYRAGYCLALRACMIRAERAALGKTVIFHFRLFDKLTFLCFNNLNKFTPLRRSYPERWRDRPCESSATDRKIKVLIPADKQSNLEDKRARTQI